MGLKVLKRKLERIRSVESDCSQFMDKIILKGIRFHGYHGVAEAERQLGQKYEIDLEMMTDLATAGKTDDLAHTIDYAQVVQLALKIGTQQFIPTL